MKVRPRLLLITNRKWHIGFQMTWQSLTLDDPEYCWQIVLLAILASSGLLVKPIFKSYKNYSSAWYCRCTGLPDENGRAQILRIHTARIKDNSKLAQDVNIADLAAETKNFSGAEIEGLVRAATSTAMNRLVKVFTCLFAWSFFIIIIIIM